MSKILFRDLLFRAVIAVFLAGVAFLVAGCGSAGQGEYSGTAHLSSEGDTPLEMTMEIEQGGDEPEGSITMNLEEQMLRFEITEGSIEDGEVQLSAEGQWQLNVDGQLEGSTMTGSLYFPAFEDSGEFEISRQ